MTTVSELADLAERKPRSFWCRIGFHEMVQFEQLITTGRSACLKCGEVWNTSMFGDFALSREESARVLRKASQGRAA